jgi:hypothetical protein
MSYSDNEEFEVPGVARYVASRTSAAADTPSAAETHSEEVPSLEGLGSTHHVPGGSPSSRSGIRPSSSRNLRGTYGTDAGSMPARIPVTHAEAGLGVPLLPLGRLGSSGSRSRSRGKQTKSALISETKSATPPAHGRLGDKVKGQSSVLAAHLRDD